MTKINIGDKNQQTSDKNYKQKLRKYWNQIQPDVPSGISSEKLAAKEFLKPWNHDNANMDMICKFIKLTNPQVVLELGTFEGSGTEKIATTMNKGELWTFDAGIAPYDCLGETYGVTPDRVV